MFRGKYILTEVTGAGGAAVVERVDVRVQRQGAQDAGAVGEAGLDARLGAAAGAGEGVCVGVGGAVEGGGGGGIG